MDFCGDQRATAGVPRAAPFHLTRPFARAKLAPGGMHEFHLIDLVSQREAVRHELAGKSHDEILVWLATRGTLTPLSRVGHPNEQHVFRFESLTGRHATFTLGLTRLERRRWRRAT